MWRTARPTAVLTPDVYRDFDHRRLVRDVADSTGVRPRHVVVGRRADVQIAEGDTGADVARQADVDGGVLGSRG